MKQMKVRCISLSAFMLVGRAERAGPAEAQDAKQPCASATEVSIVANRPMRSRKRNADCAARLPGSLAKRIPEVRASYEQALALAR